MHTLVRVLDPDKVGIFFCFLGSEEAFWSCCSSGCSGGFSDCSGASVCFCICSWFFLRTAISSMRSEMILSFLAFCASMSCKSFLIKSSRSVNFCLRELISWLFRHARVYTYAFELRYFFFHLFLFLVYFSLYYVIDSESANVVKHRVVFLRL